MNYVAATALLARAYQYKGDRAMAYQYAQEVYRFQSEKVVSFYSRGEYQ